MKDTFGKDRGSCEHAECSTIQSECPEFMTVGNGTTLSCAYCCHAARFHVLKSLSGEESIVIADVEDLLTSDKRELEIDVNAEDISTSCEADVLCFPSTSTPKDKPRPKCSTDSVDNPPPYKKICLNVNSFAETSKTSVNVDSDMPISDARKELGYIPANFSDLALSVLKGDTMSSEKINRGRNQLVREIQAFLDERKLIIGSNAKENRREYQLLGDQLSKTFRKFQWLSGLKSTRSHICQGLLTCLSGRRRSSKYHKEKSVKLQLQETVSPDIAILKLESMLDSETILQSAEVQLLLRSSFSIRSTTPIKVLPFYLHVKDNLLCEISLRIGQSSTSLLEKIVDLESRFKLYTKNSDATLEDIEEFLKSSNSKPERFLAYTDDLSSLDDEKRPGPCIVVHKEDREAALYCFWSQKFVLLSGVFDRYEACLAGFGSYFLIEREYPKMCGQFLGLLEIFLKASERTFPLILRSRKLNLLLGELT